MLLIQSRIINSLSKGEAVNIIRLIWFKNNLHQFNAECIINITVHIITDNFKFVKSARQRIWVKIEVTFSKSKFSCYLILDNTWFEYKAIKIFKHRWLSKYYSGKWLKNGLNSMVLNDEIEWKLGCGRWSDLVKIGLTDPVKIP